MKAILISTLALMFALPALASENCADRGAINILQCRPDGRAGGTSVLVQKTPCGIQASLFQPRSDRTPELKRIVSPVRMKQSKRVGSPQVYSGKLFELSVNWTSSPVNGGHLGDLVAELDGMKVNERLVCYRTR